MLSAVAARKARLSQSLAHTPPHSTPPTPSPSTPLPPPDASKKLSTTSKPPSKRKPVAPAGNVSKRRRNRSRKPSPSQSARYFSQPDAFKTQDDVIVVDPTDSDSSSISPDILSEAEDSHVPISQPNSRIQPRGRGWSPSAPLPDSSDEEGSGMDDLAILDLPVPSQQDRVRLDPSPSTLSTFRPVLNQNVFCLPPSQIGNDEPLGKRTVLLLTPSDSITLLGTYSISVLQGAVTLGGVTVMAPSASLSVFAPRSAPVPIIQCLPLKAPVSNPSALQKLPVDLIKAAESFDTVIVLQELQTGIEGLGKICRTFDGFFGPSRWHRDQVRFDLGLDTVYFVRFRKHSSGAPLSDVDVCSFPINCLTSSRWTSLPLGTLQSKLLIRH